MGSATGGAGGNGPQRTDWGGGSVMHLPPPHFWENSVMYTINVQCFSLKKKQWNACIVVYIAKVQ